MAFSLLATTAQRCLFITILSKNKDWNEAALVRYLPLLWPVWQKEAFFDHLPTSSCPGSFCTTPSINILTYKSWLKKTRLKMARVCYLFFCQFEMFWFKIVVIRDDKTNFCQARPIVNRKTSNMVCWVVTIFLNLEIDARLQPGRSGSSVTD